MRLTRCFVAGPLRVGELYELPASAVTHVVRVLRLSIGAQLTLFDGRGGEYGARIVLSQRGTVRVGVETYAPIERESPLAVSLLQALARGERMDFVVQKVTELGVTRIVVFASERSVVRLEGAVLARRLEHWQAVVVSACEQSGRNRVPSVSAAEDLASACAQTEAATLRVLLDPHAELALPSALRSMPSPSELALLVGPEGGLSAAELELAQRSGFVRCRLGARVLRAETAPLAALATLQAVAGDFRD